MSDNPSWPYDEQEKTTILHAEKGITVRSNLQRGVWELSAAIELNFMSHKDAVDYYRRHFDTETGEPKRKR